uniref:Uncharacterized protein n=1 Tax=Zea mays TaxID=4577 RepID=C0P8Y7_MAIZE|nr:unknown [Zea mays]
MFTFAVTCSYICLNYFVVHIRLMYYIDVQRCCQCSLFEDKLSTGTPSRSTFANVIWKWMHLVT